MCKYPPTLAESKTLTGSQICSIIYNSLCITQSRYGLGLPLSIRPVANLNKYSEVNFAGRPFYMAGIAGFKVALCFAYLRITGSNTKSIYRRIIWFFMIFTILSHLGGTLVLIFQCTPIQRSWRPKLKPSSCLPNDTTFYVLAAITIFCDVVIFGLPIPLLAKLQINMRRKTGLIAVFSLGAFTTVCSIMRMYQISVITNSGNSTMLVLWGTIEMNVGVSIPTVLITKLSVNNHVTDVPHMSPLPHATVQILRQQNQDIEIRSLRPIEGDTRHEQLERDAA